MSAVRLALPAIHREVSLCQAVEEVLQFNRQHFLATHLSKAARKAKDTFDGEASDHQTREGAAY